VGVQELESSFVAVQRDRCQTDGGFSAREFLHVAIYRSFYEGCKRNNRARLLGAIPRGFDVGRRWWTD